MIVANTDRRPLIDGLIMIDCWSASPHKPNQNKFYQQLLVELCKFNFKCIVNVAYNAKLDFNDPSIDNTMKRYAWTNGPEHNANLIYNIINDCRSNLTTTPFFTTTILDNDRSIFLLNFDDFLHHWSTALDQQINHWLVVGGTWGQCLHTRPIGLETMARRNIPELNFYAIESGCYLDNSECVTQTHFEHNHLSWEKIGNFGYKLLPWNYK